MRLTDLALVAFNVLTASLLLNAGLSKLASPQQFHGALAELVPRLRRVLGAGTVRLLASVEVVAASALLLPPLRLPGAGLVTLLGLGFVLLGGAGRLRGSSVSCGCLGGRTTSPLGFANVAIGLALLAAVPVNQRLGVPAGHELEYLRTVVPAASLGVLALCLAINGRPALSILRPE